MPLPFSILGGAFILILLGYLVLGDLVEAIRNASRHPL
jgi:hypothetical protein